MLSIIGHTVVLFLSSIYMLRYYTRTHGINAPALLYGCGALYASVVIIFAGIRMEYPNIPAWPAVVVTIACVLWSNYDLARFRPIFI